MSNFWRLIEVHLAQANFNCSRLFVKQLVADYWLSEASYWTFFWLRAISSAWVFLFFLCLALTSSSEWSSPQHRFLSLSARMTVSLTRVWRGRCEACAASWKAWLWAGRALLSPMSWPWEGLWRCQGQVCRFSFAIFESPWLGKSHSGRGAFCLRGHRGLGGSGRQYRSAGM